ncbi:nose resistant to fluoxetine protein 6-like [Tetranychus urticae]|uniref:Nose resistant-to-fluoxetine protein N-terminal domain-containing protein n=1 Tax=Tetranychus urticae TaxID=32264 RepID=T1KP13_TETUR|nr:nose resistant to fluoxetine protein 6-like [Tetranychus urticae]
MQVTKPPTVNRLMKKYFCQLQIDTLVHNPRLSTMKFTCILCYLVFTLGQLQVVSSANSTRKLDPLVGQWFNLEKSLRTASSKLVTSFLEPIINETLQQTSVDSLCKFSLHRFLKDLASLETWATQIFDSSGKLPITGLLEGSNSHLGRYDECLSVHKGLTLGSQVKTLQGQYCSLLIRPPLPPRPKWGTISNKITSLANLTAPDQMIGWLASNAHYFYYVPIRIGLCTPSTCTPDEIRRITSSILTKINLQVELVGNECDVSTNFNLENVHLIIITFLVAFGLLVITATLVDINQLHLIKGLTNPSIVNHLKEDSTNASMPSLSLSSDRPIKFAPISFHSEKRFIKFLKCFSIRRNAKSILSMKENPTETLSHIHGIRVLTMAWIICGHTFGLVNHTNYNQSFNSEKMYNSFIFQGLLNATVCVDTFFLLSGLLTVYSVWRKVDSHQKVNPLVYTFIRYIRLTPPYLVAIGIALILPSLGQGPLWKETVNPVAEPCYSTWWTNLLYINNFVQTKDICLMHSWYLSNDFQFHIIGLILVSILVRSTQMGFLLITFLMVTSTLISFWLAAVNNYPPTIVSTSPATPERWNFILDYYYKPWTHLSSYLIGLIFGYLLASKRKFKFSKITFLLVTFSSLVSTFVSLYGIYPWNAGQQVNTILGSTYAATFRSIWSFNVALFIFYLAHHRSSILYKCLSWKGIIPLSRLTYMAYLLHPFIIWYHYGSTRQPLTGSGYSMFHSFLAFYLFTYLVSFVAGLLLESPFICLIKLITSAKSSQFKDSQQHLRSKSTNKLVYPSP